MLRPCDKYQFATHYKCVHTNFHSSADDNKFFPFQYLRVESLCNFCHFFLFSLLKGDKNKAQRDLFRYGGLRKEEGKMISDPLENSTAQRTSLNAD